MVDLAEFDWFVGKSSPLSEEVSVLEVDPGGSDQVVTEQVVVVHDVNLQGWAAWEHDREVVMLSKVWVRLVKNVVVSFGELFSITRYLDVGVRSATNVS